MKLPDFLIKAIENNTTSLGEHPAFPPEEVDTFIGFILKNQYRTVMSQISDENLSVQDIAKKLNSLVSECQKMEADSKEALEKLCNDVCVRIFDIPDDTINIESHLVDACDMSKYRMTPEPTPDFAFEDIEEMRYLNDEIYKRRMINALISGASVYYGTNIEYYIQEIYKINPKLVGLYEEIIKYNMALLYNQPDTIKNMEKTNSGKVDVYMGEVEERVTIKAEGIIFPVLLEYTIRGLLETACQQGLPSEMRQVEYILGKADYRLAENWDMRLGMPFWSIIISLFDNCGVTIDDVGANFVLMELSKLPSENFNMVMQNLLRKTKKGNNILAQLIDKIEYKKEQDTFDNFIKVKNDKYTINDNNEYTPDELLKELETIK